MVFANSNSKVAPSDFSAADRKRKTIFYAKTDVEDIGILCAQLKATRHDAFHKFHSAIDAICYKRLSLKDYIVSPLVHVGTFRVLFRITSSTYPPLILRINRLYEYGRAWDFLIESYIYPMLSSCGLSAPTVIDVDVMRKYADVDYQIMTHVAGKSLKSFEDVQTQYMAPCLLHSVGKYLAQVHNIILSGYGPLSIASLSIRGRKASGLHSSWEAYIVLRLDEHVKICQKIGAITALEAREILNVFDMCQYIFKNAPSSLLHGDVGNQNFLSDDGERITALVDWEDSMVGDPVFEIAFWGTFFRDAMLSRFLEGYQEIKRLPDDFQLRYWLYYLRIALSKTVHRWRFGYVDRPGRPSASLRIQKALHHMRILKNS